MRILIVEDELRLADIIKRGLKEEGYAVDAVGTGEEAEELALAIPFDLILLDIILPNKDGFSVCRDLRQNKVKTPILMLTAKDSVSDKVKGLDCGADDYLVKPFSVEELYARVRALLRREQNLLPQRIQVDDLVMDTTTRQVFRGQRIIELTVKEYSILEYFMRNPNIVITRSMLEHHIWDLELNSSSNLVEVFIRKLRRKIDEENGESRIQTIKGAGYRLVSR